MAMAAVNATAITMTQGHVENRQRLPQLTHETRSWVYSLSQPSLEFVELIFNVSASSHDW